MNSQSMETRLQQQATLNAKLQKRLASLASENTDEKRIARDVTVKELKSKLKETAARIRAIDAVDKRNGELAVIRAERLANPQRNMPKAKKAAPVVTDTATKKKKKQEGK